MLSVDDALAFARQFAAFSGDPALSKPEEVLAQAVERLLVELQLKTDEAEHYRAQLIQWGIPTKRRTLRKLEKGGFEAGWE